MVNEDIYHYPVPYVSFHGVPNAVSVKKDHMSQDGTRMEIRLNELGFRIEKPLPKEKPPDEIRIFVLGSSTIFNGSPLEKSIPGQLESLYREYSGANVQVYNFGFVSSVSGQELSLLIHLLSNYDPNMVIVYNGGNDVCLPTNFDPRPGFPYNFFVYESVMRKIRHEVDQNGFKWILDGVGVDYDLGGLRLSQDYGSEKWEWTIVTNYIENLIKMGRFARGCGFNLYAFLEPMLFLKDPLVGEEKGLPTTCYGIPNFDQYVQRQYERIRQMLDYLQKSEGDDRVKFIDLSLIFQHYDRCTYWDFRHVDNEGNQHIAKHIFKHLQ